MVTEADFRREHGVKAGNDGGETFRLYCGLSPHRPFSTVRRAYERGSGVSASDLYRAIVAHGGPR